MTTSFNAAGPPTRSHKDYYTALYQAALTISSSLELDQVFACHVIDPSDPADHRSLEFPQCAAAYTFSANFLRTAFE